MKHVYFSYASNMDTDQMIARCPSARLIGPVVLPHYRLAFCGYSQRWDGGVATAIRDRQSKIPGILYELSPEALFTLDLYEGVPWIYTRSKNNVIDNEGHRIKAHVYALRDREPNAPSPEYARVIARAYHKFGFDVRGLVAALKEVGDG